MHMCVVHTQLLFLYYLSCLIIWLSIPPAVEYLAQKKSHKYYLLQISAAL